jgi:hypothetical protein
MPESPFEEQDMRSGRLVKAIIVSALLLDCHSRAVGQEMVQPKTASSSSLSKHEKLDRILEKLDSLEERLTRMEGLLTSEFFDFLLPDGKKTSNNQSGFQQVLAFINECIGYRLFNVGLSKSEKQHQIEYEWERIWFVDQPSNQTPKRIDENAQETEKPPPAGVPSRIAASWENSISHSMPGVLTSGQATPGLAGRLCLFGPTSDVPMTGNGSVVMEMFVESKEGGSVKFDQREMDGKTLQQWLSRDRIGWGYTLFLPWGAHKLEMRMVRIKTCFKPSHGAPVFSESVFPILGSEDTFDKRNKPAP